MARILAFDTSGPHCVAAFSVDSAIVGQAYEDMNKGQAERLMPLLEEVLAAEGAVWEDLDALAVGIGPGNFTGIRIAVSAARGLALSLGKPAIGVSSFEVLYALDGSQRPGPSLVTLPGPRETGYVQAFQDGIPEGAPLTLDRAEAGWDDGTLGRPVPGTPIVGAHAERLSLVLGEGDPGVYPGTPQVIDWRRGVDQLARIAAERLNGAASLPRPAPLYVRPADAAPSSDPPPVILE